MKLSIEVMNMNLIQIKLKRCVLYLTEQEILLLLSIRPDIWAVAIKRGKGMVRAEQAEI
ncbi:MAG: hypothetical protein WC365_10370 [Candidatus Babeliales bacterium]|jgi:hypothetical protein